MFAALGFFWMVPAALQAQSVPGEITKVGMYWLVGVYFIHTLGELCLSPVGMSYVSKLAPKQIGSQLMGAWFFATGCGSYIAGKAAGMMESVPLWQLFIVCGGMAMVMSLILWFLVSRLIYRLMGGHS
jgi:POT family proton-dependent oligopeptide transporter